MARNYTDEFRHFIATYEEGDCQEVGLKNTNFRQQKTIYVNGLVKTMNFNVINDLDLL